SARSARCTQRRSTSRRSPRLRAAPTLFRLLERMVERLMAPVPMYYGLCGRSFAMAWRIVSASPCGSEPRQRVLRVDMQLDAARHGDAAPRRRAARLLVGVAREPCGQRAAGAATR